MSEPKTYEQGLIEGRIQHLEDRQAEDKSRLDANDERWKANDRIIYGILGAIALVQVVPVLREVLG